MSAGEAAVTPVLCSSSNTSLAARAAWAGRSTRDAASSISGERASRGRHVPASRCRAPHGGAAIWALMPPLAGSQGSVEVQSILLFGHGNDTIASDAAEQQLRNSLDRNGFIMDLHLASIQSEWELRAGGVRAGRAPQGCFGGLHRRCPVLAEAGRLLGGGTGSGLAAGRANAISQCLWWTALGRPTGSRGGGLIPSHPFLGVSQGCLSRPAPWLCPAAQTRLWFSFRRRGSDVPGTGACGPGLGHCSAGPGLHPAAAEHPHLPSAGESPIPIPVRACLLLLGPLSLSPCRQAPNPFPP